MEKETDENLSAAEDNQTSDETRSEATLIKPQIEIESEEENSTRNDKADVEFSDTSTTKKSDSLKATTASPSSKRGGALRVIFILLNVFVLAALAAAGYFAYQEYVKYQDKLSAADANQNVLNENIAELKNTVAQAQKQNAELVERLASAEQSLQQKIDVNDSRITAQQNRIRAMSTTSREDWLLAEAEYLLKLANQRVLIEKNASSAIGLLEESDSILRDMQDPQLFTLRQAIARDLAALKLADKIDVEGIYLSISALSEEVENIPLYTSKENKPKNDYIGDEAIETSTEKSFFSFLNTFKDYVRIVDHAEKPQVLLSPESTLYLRQNLRLILERAQLALLREQTLIYRESLEQASAWLSRYFPQTSKAAAFKSEIDLLKDREILAELPNISTSLELLHNYIEELHNLGSTKALLEGSAGGDQ